MKIENCLEYEDRHVIIGKIGDQPYCIYAELELNTDFPYIRGLYPCNGFITKFHIEFINSIWENESKLISEYLAG